MLFSLSILRDFVDFIKKSFKQHASFANWGLLLNMAYIVVNTSYFISYFKIVDSRVLFNGFPHDLDEPFNSWKELAIQQKEIYKFSGFLTIFLIIRLMELAQERFFKSLRIVFYVFASTSQLLVSFFLAVGLFLIAFLAYSNLVLVQYERSFVDVYKSFEIIALSIFRICGLNPTKSPRSLLGGAWECLGASVTGPCAKASLE